MLTLIRNCKYISIVNCSTFFYQWRVHLNNKHKFIVVNYRKQKSFNVAVMSYKNFSAYVQRQINRLLRRLRKFARVYVDDIVMFSHTKVEHETHFRDVFFVLTDNNVFIKSTKAFLDYFSVSLLGQKINSFELAIVEDKLKTIAKLHFFRTLRQLKLYLDIIDWLRNYVYFYANIFASLQRRKIELLRHNSVAEIVRRSFVNKTRIERFTELKIAFFKVIQKALSQFSYLIPTNSSCQLYINLNVNKKFDINVMLYYIKRDVIVEIDKFSSRHAIESVLFLNWLITDIETRYWSTELKIAEIVWILKKTRYIVEAFSSITVIYTNHGVALKITFQIILFIIFTNKLNLRFVRVSNYIQRFNLNIKHKSEKQHVISNALSRFVSANINRSLKKVVDEKELNVLFIASLIKMNSNFKSRIIVDYKFNLNWQRISAILNVNVNNGENVVKLLFYKREDDLIFRFDDIIINDHAYELRRFCISHLVVQNILQLAHDKIDYVNYAKCYEQICFF